MRDERLAGAGSARGVTLIEMMITLAVLSIIVAIAVPDLVPMVHAQRVSGSAEEVASFVDRARRMAIAERRCVRVVVTPAGDALEVQRLRRPDCVTAPTDWSPPLAAVRAAPGISFLLETLPGNEPDARSLVFRPNGRLRGDGDLAVIDDGGRVFIAHARVAKTAHVVVTATGRVCWRAYASPNAAALVSPVSCPKEAI